MVINTCENCWGLIKALHNYLDIEEHKVMLKGTGLEELAGLCDTDKEE